MRHKHEGRKGADTSTVCGEVDLKQECDEKQPATLDHKKARVDTLIETSWRAGIPGQRHISSYFYAVAEGNKPGIYNDWDEAKKQAGSLPNQHPCKFNTRVAAAEYLKMKGLPDSEIRLFRTTFMQLPNFTPNPTAPYQDEFERLASSQQMTPNEVRKARTIGIHDEIIRFFLPNGGVRFDLDGDDEDDEVYIDDEEALYIYQAMCRVAGKPVHSSIDPCLLELKRRPYVNIVDFVNTYRTGRPVRTFESWDRFKEYTLNGHRINLKEARDNEFLAPLLQNFRHPSLYKCPLLTKEFFKKRREAKREARPKVKQQKLEANQSNFVFGKASLELSRSPTPISEPDVPIKNEPVPSASAVKPELFTSPVIPLCQVDDHPESLSRPSTLHSESGSPVLISSAPVSEISDTDLIELQIKLERSTQNSTMPPKADKEVELIDLTQVNEDEDATAHNKSLAVVPSASLKRHWTSAPAADQAKRQRINIFGAQFPRT